MEVKIKNIFYQLTPIIAGTQIGLLALQVHSKFVLHSDLGYLNVFRSVNLSLLVSILFMGVSYLLVSKFFYSISNFKGNLVKQSLAWVAASLSLTFLLLIGITSSGLTSLFGNWGALSERWMVAAIYSQFISLILLLFLGVSLTQGDFAGDVRTQKIALRNTPILIALASFVIGILVYFLKKILNMEWSLLCLVFQFFIITTSIVIPGICFTLSWIESLNKNRVDNIRKVLVGFAATLLILVSSL